MTSIFSASSGDSVVTPAVGVDGSAGDSRPTAHAANSLSSSRGLPAQPTGRPAARTRLPEELESYLPLQEASFNDLFEVNKAITTARHMIIRCEQFVRECSTDAVTAKLEYERIRRRHLLSSSGKTVADRSAIAEIECEQQEANYRYSEALLETGRRLSTALRADLSALESIANNIRAQMKLI